MKIKNIANKFFNRDIYIPTVKELLIIASLLGILTSLELQVFQPMGTYAYTSAYKSILLAGYGVIAALVFLIAFALPIVLFRRGKEGDKGKVWKLITLFVFQIFIMAVCIDFYHMAWFPNDYKYNFLIRFPAQVRNIIFIGLFPFSLLLFWLIHKSSTVKITNSNQDVDDIDACITVKSSLRGSSIKIKIFDILYMKSDRNYVEINYLEDSIEKKAIQRGSLASMIKELPEGLFCRIHNSYLVNLSLISAPYTVNSKYFVRLSSLKELVLPVSRTYLKAVRVAIAK